MGNLCRSYLRYPGYHRINILYHSGTESHEALERQEPRGSLSASIHERGANKVDTKQEILSMARSLFTEHGYNGVSMRDIAAALTMSVGNLTYHFKKKEELVEAIVLDMEKAYTTTTAPQTLYELDHLISHIQDLGESFSFYFSHRTQLAQISDKIKKLQIRMLRENNHLWKNTFNNLRLAGLIKDEQNAQKACNTEQNH